MFFISIGVYFLMMGKDLQKESNRLSEHTQNIAHDNKESKVEKVDIKTKKDSGNRAVELYQLAVPANIPPVVNLYFGSQSGTAEKYCKILEEEA